MVVDEALEEKLKREISQVKLLLDKQSYDLAIEKLRRLKRNFTSYPSLDSGYLVDYFLGMALQRKKEPEKFLVDEVNEIIDIYSKSLALNENFAGSHFLIGSAWMNKGRFVQNDEREKVRKQAVYHLARAKELKPELTNPCNKGLLVLIETDLLLCHPNEEKTKYWRGEFKDYTKVEIVTGDILEQNCDAIVSPANSFGFMDGGLDLHLSEHFGLDLQKKLQEIIKEKHRGELPVGLAEIIETGNNKVPYLISTPTMRLPRVLDEDSINAYLATRAALLAIEEFNKKEKKIKRVAMPFMCTGVGKMLYENSARQMKVAYDDVFLGKYSFPKDLGEAMDKRMILYPGFVGKFNFEDLRKAEVTVIER